MSKSICIILARGGSKRIPKKNIKIFHGRPIIEYSIEAARKSALFDEIMVSTDDSEISKIALKCGASVPFLRSKKNSDDFSTTFDVLEEVLLQYKNDFEYACCLYACAPFISGQKLINAFNKIKKFNFDCVFPIIKYSFPIQRALRCNGINIEFLYPENSLLRSQDLESIFHDAGQFYFFNPKNILQKKHLITSNSGYIIIDEMEGQDIDTINDWKLAEMKYEILQSFK